MPQVMQGLALRKSVERCVGDLRFAGGELGQEAGTGAVAQPLADRLGVVHRFERLRQLPERGRDLPIGSGEQVTDPSDHDATGASVVFVGVGRGPALIAGGPERESRAWAADTVTVCGGCDERLVLPA